MKRNITVVLVVLSLGLATLSWGKGPQNVTNGPHNLSLTGVDQYTGVPGTSLYRTDEDSVCVFCHTPHGGSLSAPLWNRNSANPASWKHYNSASMSVYIDTLATNRAPNDESMVCLSCHDGSISVNHLINTPNDRVTPIQSWNGDPDTEIIDDIIFGLPANRIGGSLTTPGGTGDLSDDHPISFSYDSVLAGADYSGGPKQNQLHPTATAVASGVRFFTAANNVECASCHDPHVDYLNNPEYTPFLIMPNTGSDLCLACHNK